VCCTRHNLIKNIWSQKIWIFPKLSDGVLTKLIFNILFWLTKHLQGIYDKFCLLFIAQLYFYSIVSCRTTFTWMGKLGGKHAQSNSARQFRLVKTYFFLSLLITITLFSLSPCFVALIQHKWNTGEGGDNIKAEHNICLSYSTIFGGPPLKL
jgi:hypothetical protein